LCRSSAGKQTAPLSREWRRKVNRRSFLDSNNTDLIRWSDDGRSFIVLDEDEFARTLIPELFKHNNYASFVRQLNMYGFHKTVNITDGSLRQSEKARKGVKPPSMYSHPYFRKNRPDLLWLIQKPSSKSSGKRKRDGLIKENFDSDEERQFSPAPGGPHELGAPGSSNQDLAQLPRNELANVRRELHQLQSQQRFISQMITQLKEQNDQFYRQATAFQAMHDRHENSINAILTFLATFYNRSLEGHGAQNLVNMFNSTQQNQPQQENRVVEEFKDGAPENGNQQIQRLPKRPQLLLPGPIANIQQQDHALQTPGTAVTAPSSARTSVSPPNGHSKRNSASSLPPDGVGRSNSTTASPTLKNDTPTPNLLPHVAENGSSNDDIVSFINNINSTAGTPSASAPAFDFSSALDHYQTANGNAPLTPQQRDNMLALIANQHTRDSNQNNALIAPQPPVMPDLGHIEKSQQQLEMLTNMQKRQDQKVQELNRRLQPLSPTGSIPGLASSPNGDPLDLTGAPGEYDPSSIFDFDNAGAGWHDPVAATTTAAGDPSFDFDFNGAGAETGDINWDFGAGADGDMFATSAAGPVGQQQVFNDGRRVESVSSSATSPATTAAEHAGVEDDGRMSKRVRQDA
jgi:heat shock transcription factor, other eukaryote